MADVLGKAASAEGVPKEVLEGEDSKYLKEMHRGLELTESQLQQVRNTLKVFCFYVFMPFSFLFGNVLEVDK